MREREAAGRTPAAPPLRRRAPAGGERNSRSARDSALVPREKRPFWCRVCEHEADATWTGEEWLIGSFGSRCPRGGDCLRALAAEVGTTAPKLKADPLPYLANAEWLHDTGRNARASAKPPPLPSIGAVDGWASALLSSGRPLDYLVQHRQLHADVLAEYGVGWDSAMGDLTFPVLDRGQLVQLYRRKPRDGAKMRAACGRPRPPYPDLPPNGAICLVAGELDALTGRQIGMRAVTVSGCNVPKDVEASFAERVVYVMFDVGEELAQVKAIERLENVDATVYDVRLSDLGLPHGSDLNDAVRAGIGAAEIRQLIRARSKQQRRR
jgi:hypothetical protein